MFDECISRPQVARLVQLVTAGREDAPEVVHILDFQEQGVADEVWIPRIASDNWIVVSQDRGKGGRRKGSPLPALCVEFRITHVLLSNRVAARKSVDKMDTILSVWNELLALANEPPGSRYMLVPRDAQGRFATSGRLEKRNVPLPLDPPP